MNRLLSAVRRLTHGLVVLYVLVHEGDDDIHGTYPDQYRPTGEQTATQGSVTFNLLGMGH